ncbi:MAG: DUF2017 domain-containing protein [Sporichthyaceae bacterium]
MSSRMRRERGGAVIVAFADGEAEVIRAAFADLLDLLETRSPDAPAAEIAPGVPDPFASMGSPDPPEDEALLRLFPDAYPDDVEAASEYRRFTEGDLLARKRANIAVLLAGLEEAETGGSVRLDEEAVVAWLLAVNDLRLALGTRLEIVEDYEDLVDGLEPDDPRLPAFALYEWLTGFQEMLVGTQHH